MKSRWTFGSSITLVTLFEPIPIDYNYVAKKKLIELEVLRAYSVYLETDHTLFSFRTYICFIPLDLFTDSTRIAFWSNFTFRAFDTLKADSHQAFVSFESGCTRQSLNSHEYITSSIKIQIF